MRSDFHYCAIRVLAEASGFSAEAAELIAYASQYVDDATESEPIRVGDALFEPVRSAYLGPLATDWSVQKRIYIPFHFIPPRPMPGGPGRFVTEADSPFSRALVKAAAAEPAPVPRLCRLGIAVHTYADSWAHQGFSGRRHPENDIEDIHEMVGGRWRHLRWANIAWDFLPDIGHAEAGSLPDLSWVRWRYRRSGEDAVVERDNARLFLAAARAIYLRLRRAAHAPAGECLAWRDIKGLIAARFADTEEDPAERSAAWARALAGVFGGEVPTYDRYAWRDEALAPARRKDLEWDDFKPDDFRHLRFPMRPGFLTSRWVAFHRAALRQRHFVLERLL
jgi:hypothetical protein